MTGINDIVPLVASHALSHPSQGTNPSPRARRGGEHPVVLKTPPWGERTPGCSPGEGKPSWGPGYRGVKPQPSAP